MREILFRGKRIDNGKWTYGYVFDDGIIGSKRMFVGGLVITDYVGNCDDEYEVGYAIEEVENKSVGQWTGLHDRNNVRIFEGDIVKSKMLFGISVVEFRNGMFEAVTLDGKASTSLSTGILIGDGKIEVIGNIYDNPELLKEEEN